MLRVFAIVGVLAAFGAALYFSGDYLQEFEAPEPPAQAAPARPAKKKAKPKQRARPAKKRAPRQAAWLTELNAFCIRVLDESDYDFEPPSRPEEIAPYIRRVERRNTRVNRRAAELIQRSGDAKSAAALRRLFGQEERLVHSALSAAQKGDAQGFSTAMRSLLAVARSENRLLTRLGAVDCTLPPDAFEY